MEFLSCQEEAFTRVLRHAVQPLATTPPLQSSSSYSSRASDSWSVPKRDGDGQRRSIILMEINLFRNANFYFYQNITFSLSLKKDELNSSQVSLSEYLDIVLFIKQFSPEYRKRQIKYERPIFLRSLWSFVSRLVRELETKNKILLNDQLTPSLSSPSFC